MNIDLTIKKKKDGTNYTIRHDRRRFFYPSEWFSFIKKLGKEEYESTR